MSAPIVSIVVISKDEPTLSDTLTALHGHVDRPTVEIVVVDASQGRLKAIQAAHPAVRWIDFERPPGATVTIPHQRNVGVAAAAGDVVVFSDCGCVPHPEWLQRLTAPILEGNEDVTCGTVESRGPSAYDRSPAASGPTYVPACPTINMAFRRSAFLSVGGFDESFAYGSDIDFTWRLTDQGLRIRMIPDAVVEHEWGSSRRQVKRALAYGSARVRLYRKHRHRLVAAVREDPVPIVYPLFLLGLPLTLRYRWYPLALLVPLWRNRRLPNPGRVVVDHLVQGVGALAELARVGR